MIGGLGMPELIIILVIILIIFGAGKLPEIGAGLGKGIPKSLKLKTKKTSRKKSKKTEKKQLLYHLLQPPLDKSVAVTTLPCYIFPL